MARNRWLSRADCVRRVVVCGSGERGYWDADVELE